MQQHQHQRKEENRYQKLNYTKGTKIGRGMNDEFVQCKMKN